MIIKPFKRKNCFTPIDNAVFDYLQPLLSHTEYGILSFIIRQTRGYNRDSIRISTRHVSKLLHTPRNTAQRAIDELVKKGLVIRNVGNGRSASSYKLNLEFEIDTEKFSSEKIQDGEISNEKTCGPNTGHFVAQIWDTKDNVSPLKTNCPNQAKETGKKHRIILRIIRNFEEDKPLFDRLALGIIALKKNEQTAALMELLSLLFGDDNLPDYKRLGRFRKTWGIEDGLRMILRYISVPIEGNPLFYIEAAEAKRRKELREKKEEVPLPTKPVVDDVDYTLSEINWFVTNGFLRDDFHQHGFNELGDPVYIYHPIK